MDRDAERGASAVELALVLPILLLFLFGTIQYGYGFFQLQSFNSALSDTARTVANGLPSCSALNQTWSTLTENSGIAAGDIGSPDVRWLTSTGQPTGTPQRLGLVEVTAQFTPFKIPFPGIPFPSTITRTKVVTIQDLAALNLNTC